MIVVDASALTEVLIDSPRADALSRLLLDDPDHVAPDLIDAEVLHVVARLHRQGRLDTTAATQAIDDLASWPGERWPVVALLGEAWALRQNLSTYDAIYVALASLVGAPLVTLDETVARAPGLPCEVIVPPA